MLILDPSSAMHVDPQHFWARAYDIPAGVVRQDALERGSHAEHLGRAFRQRGRSPPARKAVAVGRATGGLSGPGLAAALIRGLPARTGLDAVDLGAVTTPMCSRHARRAWLLQWHPGHRQPQPEGLQRPRWCWPVAPSTATTSRACARPSRPRPTQGGRSAGMGHRAEYTARASWRHPASAADEDRGRLRQRHPGASAPGILRAWAAR